MCKVDFEFSTKCLQGSIGCVKQGVCGNIIHRSEPFALEYSPQRLCDIQMWAVWRKKKEEQTALLPYRTKFPHESASVYACIVKYNKRILTDAERKLVNKVCNYVGGHVFSSITFIFAMVVSVYLYNAKTYANI